MADKKIKRIEMELYRKDGETRFRFSIPSEIEAIYKKGNPEIRESSSPSWKGMKFYYMPELTGSTDYQNRLNRFGLFDDYGMEFYRDGKMNIAWLRTVGGKGDMPMRSNASYAEIALLVRNVVDFIKGYFEDYLRDFRLKGIVEIEIG